MSVNIKLKKGFDINLKGKPEKKLEKSIVPETYSVKPTDFVSFLKPKVLVGEGDKVKAGTPLYFDKSLPKVKFCAPVSGEVVAVRRGAKRKLLEFKIKADSNVEYEENKSYTASDLNNLKAEEIKEQMTSGGVWPHIIQRPFAVVANPDDTPKSIHISTFDTSPLAADINFLLEGDDEDFKMGVEVLKKLTSGKVNINVNGAGEVAPMFTSVHDVQVNTFSGPHPAGNVGVQIHHTDPIGKDELVWTVKPAGVVQIGRFFRSGKYDTRKRFALVGSEVKTPQYFETLGGAPIKPFIQNNLTGDNVRIISGNVLSGEKIAEDDAIGFYDTTVTVIPEGDDYKFFGSFQFSKERLSYQRAFGLFSFLNKFTNPSKEYVVDANINGEHRAFVQTGVFEQVLPMDIYPMHLLKAIMTEDYDAMEELGIFEVAEEDMALCEFVDVSKHEIQAIVRKGIDLIQNS